ncbi:MAG: hypothetical protein WC537_01635 [Candidatus Paceibacterota bacterium]|jgi:hypothetical protein
MAEIKSPSAGGVSGLSVIVALMILFSIWMVNNGPEGINSKNKVASQTKTTSSQNQKTNTTNHSSTKADNNNYYLDSQGQRKKYSPYRDQISISANSVSTDSPNKEYITLSAHGNIQPINISGWTLKNGRDKKTYIVSGTAVRGQAVYVKIPDQGVVLYNPFNPSSNIHGPITLRSGEKATITTGSVPTAGSVVINENFKINRCLGYVEDRPVNQRSGNYRFSPTLIYKCPTSRDLPSIDSLDQTCYDFVRSISSCHQPTDIYDKINGTCLDRNCKLSSFCQSFVKQNFNPLTCFRLYSADKDFIGDEWRIYLNRTWELWDKQRETISLFDRSGLLVTEKSY